MNTIITTRLLFAVLVLPISMFYAAGINAAGNPVNIDIGISRDKPIIVAVEHKDQKIVKQPVIKKVKSKPKVTKNNRGKAGYLVNSGDILNISVWKENELQGDVIVRPDGKISFPLVGDVLVEGKKISEIHNDILKKLKHYIPEPVLTVAVKKLSGHKLYVIGKVQRPGVFLIEQQTDIMQVLSMAGGLTSYANSDEIKVLRREGKVQKIFHFDYSKIESGEGLDANRILKSGDVVVVP